MPTGIVGLNSLSLDQYAIDSVCSRITVPLTLEQVLPTAVNLLQTTAQGDLVENVPVVRDLLSTLSTTLSTGDLNTLLDGLTTSDGQLNPNLDTLLGNLLPSLFGGSAPGAPTLLGGSGGTPTLLGGSGGNPGPSTPGSPTAANSPGAPTAGSAPGTQPARLVPGSDSCSTPGGSLENFDNQVTPASCDLPYSVLTRRLLSQQHCHWHSAHPGTTVCDME